MDTGQCRGLAVKTAAEIIDSTLSLLIDPDGVRWSRSECLAYVNEALTALTNVRQDLITETVTETCVEGCKQAITGTRFIEVVRHTDGDTITQAPMEPMDRMVPGWRGSQNPQDKAQHFLFTSKTPTTYWLYPAVTEGLQLEVKQVMPVQVMAAESDEIPVPDKWASVLTDYCIHRAYSKSSDTEDQSKAQAYLAQFNQVLAQVSQSEMGASA